MHLTSSFKVIILLLASFLVGVFYPEFSHAEEKKDKSAKGAALLMEKMKQDMQLQMEQDKATMQAQFDKQKLELEAKVKSKDDQLGQLDGKLTNAERKAKNVESGLAKTNSEKAVLETKQQQTQAQLEATQQKLHDLEKLYDRAQVDLKFNDNQRKAISSNQAETNKLLNACEDKNARLHQFGVELIQIYDKPQTYEAVMRKESFFQLKRVELENILQSYQDKVDVERIASRK